ncbi:MAG: ATP-binding protein, partial [Burkholderiaceae bacterium]
LTDGRRGEAANYTALAVALATGADPRLAITRGLPVSGKTFVSQALIEHAGAIRVRSDVERKRLHGLGALASSGGVAGGIYDTATTQRTYARLQDVARGALEAGWAVVVDAAFLRRDERTRFAALAESMALPFTILDCRAPMQLLRQRIAQRRAAGSDASEADEGVLDRLREFDEALEGGEAAHALVVDAALPLEPAQLASAWLEVDIARRSPGSAG